MRRTIGLLVSMMVAAPPMLGVGSARADDAAAKPKKEKKAANHSNEKTRLRFIISGHCTPV